MGVEVAIIGGILSAASAAASAYSQRKAAKEEEKLAREQSRMEQEAAETEASNVRQRGARLLASQRAALAASGVKIDEGTGDTLQKETARLTEQDALAVLKGGANRAALLKGQADMAGDRAKAAVVGGVLDTAATAVSGYGKVKQAQRAGELATQMKQDAASQDLARRSGSRYSLLNGSAP